MTNDLQSFEPFAEEAAYVRVNEKLVRRLLSYLRGRTHVRLLDVAAGTGLMTAIAHDQAAARGIKLDSTLVDLDRPALELARDEVATPGAQYVYALADKLPLRGPFDAAIFANSIHLLDDDAKATALAEVRRVLEPSGVLGVNSTFYVGAYPEESKPFYSRWMRRAIAEMNQRLPNRVKSERAQAMEWLGAEDYRSLMECNGFKVVELRERHVGLSQSAVRAISSYKDFAMGALHATDEDAEEASRALQVTVQRTFRDLNMKFLARNWLELVAVRA